MDDLYDDLENYNEVNVVDELRNENKDLKLKLEEYETAMEKLQKSLLQDYDNLSMEFNNLQANYSSLLKTARAEVERKTKMITQLNHEKDEMVLQALHGNKKNIHNRMKFQRSLPNKKPTTDTNQLKSDKKVIGDTRKNNSNTNIESGVSANTALISHRVNQLNTVVKGIEKVDKCISQGELKKNISQNKPECKDAPKITASSIKNRRKSMPAISLPLLSSDEEDEPKKPTIQIKNKSPPNDLTEKRDVNMILQRISQESSSNKRFSHSNVDASSSNCQELSREGYRNRLNRIQSDRHKISDRSRDSDRLRDFDKCKEGDKYRETDKHRETDKYRDNDKYREGNKYAEVNKFRESDKYRDIDKHRDGDRRGQCNKYVGDKFWDMDKGREGDRFRPVDKYRERNRQRDSDKHRDGDKYRDGDKFRDRKCHTPDRATKRSYREYQDEFNRHEYAKHRVLESPSSEAHSHSSYHHKSQENHERYSHDSGKYKSRHDDSHVDKYSKPNDYEEPSNKRQKVDPEQLDENKKYDGIPKPKPRFEVNEFDLAHISCQSPDAAFSPEPHTEATAVVHAIKEIKNTAATPLEDPRVTSKKYVLKAENGKTTISTAVSKTIDIKPVDKSLWNIESVAVPEALLQKPPLQLNEEHIKEIYMDIDVNPEGNVSVESGEICSNFEDDTVPDTREELERVNKNFDLKKHPIELHAAQKAHTEVIETVKPTYRIPKVKQNDVRKVPEIKKVSPPIISEDNIVGKSILRESQPFIQPQSLPHIDTPQSHDNDIPVTKANNKTYESELATQNLVTLSNMAMVQDDLELSDETSDNVDFHKEIVHKTQTTPVPKEDASEHKNSFKSVLKENVNTDLANVTTDDKARDNDGQKKQKTRRKTKSKEKELRKNPDVLQSTEKRTRSKKDKDSKPKPIKNKFTDLFGDSSSLITPEDLGIPSACVPLCEDAQDAVDLNIKEIVNTPLASIGITEESNKDSKNVISEENTHNFSNPNTEDKVIVKRIEEQLVRPVVDTNVVYQNLNTETNKPDVVKTVIISSGIQPQFALSNKNGAQERRVADVEVNIQNIVECNPSPAIMELKSQIPLKALATSTPHKEFSVMQALEIDFKPVECKSYSNDSKNESVNSVDKSETNTQNAHDAPDVRIFVRRRKKGVKKT